MTRLIGDISISLDGFVAGPNPSLEEPLGEGGELLHEWAFAAASWPWSRRRRDESVTHLQFRCRDE